MRLFVAVRPSLEAAAHVDLAIALARASGPEVLRWTVPENRHLTLAFYGEVPDGVVPELVESLRARASQTPPFRLRLRGAGVFSGRTVWLGAGGDVPAMAALARDTTEAGLEVLGRQDARPRHRAHLTVARLAQRAVGGHRRGRRPARDEPGRVVDGLVRALSTYDGPEWRVEEMVLVESHPGEGRSGGPRYDDVVRLPLGHGGLPSHGRSPEVGDGRH